MISVVNWVQLTMISVVICKHMGTNNFCVVSASKSLLIQCLWFHAILLPHWIVGLTSFLSLRIDCLVHTLVTCVKLFCRLVFMSYKDGKSKSIPRFPSYPGWWAAQQTDEEDLHLKECSKTAIVSVFANKLKDLVNSRGSYIPSYRYGDLRQHSCAGTHLH